MGKRLNLERAHASSQPEHTLNLLQIIDLREALKELQYAIRKSSLDDAYRSFRKGRDYDPNDILLSVFPSNHMAPVVCDILLDFSPDALFSFLGGKDKVREVVRIFGNALTNFKEDLARVKEKPRASTEEKSRGVAAACGFGAAAC